MRRKDREVTDQKEIFDILNRCDTVRIAMQGEKYPYVVPVSFGAEMQDGKPVWKDKRCAHCMSCIQNCPKDAIEYKDTTVGKKRYSVARVNYKQSL